MKIRTILTLSSLAVALYGCSPATPGGPGTALPDSKKPMVGQTDDTFTLDVPMMATKVEQGGMVKASIGIKRGTNFAQDVTLKFADIPAGVSIEPGAPAILRTAETVEFTIIAAADAALGDFKVKVSGHPRTGADANSEMSLTVNKHMAEEAKPVQTDAARLEWDAHLQDMRRDLDALQLKYEDLKVRAAAATGDAKAALDKKVASAKVKLDEAEATLKEAKDAGPDRWDKIKEGFSGALTELKSMFE